MPTSVVAGISSNSKASSTTAIFIGTFGGTRFGGYHPVLVRGGKQPGTGDSILTGSGDASLPGGT